MCALGLSGDFNYTKVIVYGRKCRKQEAHFTIHKKVFSGFIHIWMASFSYWRQCYTECICMFCGTFIYRAYNIKNTYTTSHHDSDVVQLAEIMFISHTSSFLVYRCTIFDAHVRHCEWNFLKQQVREREMKRAHERRKNSNNNSEIELRGVRAHERTSVNKQQ